MQRINPTDYVVREVPRFLILLLLCGEEHRSDRKRSGGATGVLKVAPISVGVGYGDQSRL